MWEVEMSTGYTFRYWNDAGEMLRFRTTHCQSDYEAMCAAIRGMTKAYTTLEVEMYDEVIWRGTMVEAQAAVTRCWPIPFLPSRAVCAS
jgi:hypothetical protein